MISILAIKLKNDYFCINTVAMNTTVIRQKLHNYLEVANDKKVKAMYTMVEEAIAEEGAGYTDEFKAELDRRDAAGCPRCDDSRQCRQGGCGSAVELPPGHGRGAVGDPRGVRRRAQAAADPGLRRGGQGGSVEPPLEGLGVGRCGGPERGDGEPDRAS